MRRTILSVAYPFTEVGVDAVGGSEQILAMLDHALTADGHQSLVIAAEGSQVEGTLIPSPKATGLLDDSVRDRGKRVHRQLIDAALANYDVDLVHLHSLDFHCYLPAANVPVLATLHLPPDWYPKKIFEMDRKHFHMNCVSWSQHQSCPRSTHLLTPVPNGVNVDKLDGVMPRQNFALAMGRICPEKGFHFALDAARSAGTELLLAGEVFPYQSHLEYFRTQIEPRLDSARRFIGPLRFQKKKHLLSQAKCLIVPSTVAETSSLVAMEALACGTPVIAFRSGALPEIIDHGRTGFLVANVDEMSRALRDVDGLKAETCRQAARSRFSAQAMVTKYLDLYKRLTEQHSKEEAPAVSLRNMQWAVNP